LCNLQIQGINQGTILTLSIQLFIDKQIFF